MKYDTIIIGGGLSGLVAGVKLASAKKRVAIITSGQSALHFLSGSIGLLSAVDGEPVSDPIASLEKLPENHPYNKIGAGRISSMAGEAADILKAAGIVVDGNAGETRYRLTPLGAWEPTWLVMDGIASCPHPSKCPWRKATVVNFHGYLDFFPEYVADGLREAGIEAECREVKLPELVRLRKSCSEMRAASIAKILRGEVLRKLAIELNALGGDSEVLLLPAVIGLKSMQETEELQAMVKKPIRYVPVIPMSVAGVRAQSMLRNYFEKLGGTYFLGDSVSRGNFSDGRLESVHTANLGETVLEADDFILATGSFFSQGLVAKPDAIVEPVFGLDVDQTAERTERYDKNFFAPQRYMRFGVETDKEFRVSRGGKTVANLRAIGSILSGADPLKEGSGAGIALLSAVCVARKLITLN